MVIAKKTVSQTSATIVARSGISWRIALYIKKIGGKIYVEEVLKKFKMSSCNLVSTPMEPGTKLSKYSEGDHAWKYQSLIRSLRNLINTRPNSMLSIWITDRYMAEPKYTHWKALKWILRYVRGTMSLNLMYTRTGNYRLVGYWNNNGCREVDAGKARLEMYSLWET